MALLLAYGLYLVVDVWIHRDEYLWDYRSCYYNGWDYREGVLPYARTLMRQPRHAPKEVYNFLYHPVLLWLFAGWSLVEFHTAYSLYVLLSVGALGATIALWRRAFLPRDSGLLLYLLCLFGFNSAFYRGFEAGNINTFDIALVWLAFYMFVKERHLAFILLVVAVSLGKGFPIVLLGLLFFIEGRRKWRYILWAGLVFAAVHGITFAIHPKALLEYAAQKVHILREPLEGPEASMPSTRAILYVLFRHLAARKVIDFAEAPILLVGSYLGLAVTVVMVSVRGLRRLRVKGEERRIIVVFMGAFLLALILPHFKDYSYALLIPPTYVVITRQRFVGASALLAGIVMVPYVWEKLPGVKAVGAFLAPYGVVFIAYGLWMTFLVMISRQPRSVVERTPEGPQRPRGGTGRRVACGNGGDG